ncbi:MAG: (2Fe-2S)-binding protein [Burkholderiales bacterium]|nr:(2Fe-2S)-binding protein [Burkholderiales bacterium]
MFRTLPETGDATVTVTVDGSAVRVPAHATAAAAVLLGEGVCRTTPVSGTRRAPYCMMGACFDCLMEIDGVPNRQGCLVTVAEGMRIERQEGTRKPDGAG